MLKGREVIIKGKLDRVRDIIYCEDAIEAMLSCIKNELSWNNIINIGTGRGITIKEIIFIIAKVINIPFEEFILKEELATFGDPHSNVADISLLREIGKFESKYDLESALREMIK